MSNPNILYLDRNENQYGPSPACLKELLTPTPDELNNYSRDFMRGFKSRLSERLSIEYGIKEKNVILGYGGEDLLKQAVHCYVHKGEKIMIPSYSWWYYRKIADEVEGIKVEYPIVEGKDTFYYDLEGMIEVYNRNKPKLVFISSPNNPTGNRLEFDELVRVLEFMRDTVVVLDEAYSLFYNGDHTYLRELIARFPNLLIIRTFSKYHALASLRIGFALVGENHSRFSLFTSRYLGLNCISERVAIAALDSDEYYREVSKKMVLDMEMYFSEINIIPGFKAFRSYANFILVRLPAEIKDELQKLLTARGIIVKFMEEEELKNHIRITIGKHEQNRLVMDLIKSCVMESHLL